MPSEGPPTDAYDFEHVLKLSVLRTGELVVDGEPTTMESLE